MVISDFNLFCGGLGMGTWGNSEYVSKIPNCRKHPICDLAENCGETFAGLALFVGSWLGCNLD